MAAMRSIAAAPASATPASSADSTVALKDAAYRRIPSSSSGNRSHIAAISGERA